MPSFFILYYKNVCIFALNTVNVIYGIIFMDFNEFKSFIKSIDVPAQRMGIFNLTINHDGKTYYFNSLKENYSGNDDLFGFGLNHHYTNCAEQPTESSIFHDSEDISIGIWREEFISAEKESDNKINIKTKKWNAILTFNED
jgi:hypothetical protein